MQKLIKSNNDIYYNEVTNIYDDLPKGNYLLMFNEMRGEFFLREKNDFKFPSKIYGKNTNFIERVLKPGIR